VEMKNQIKHKFLRNVSHCVRKLRKNRQYKVNSNHKTIKIKSIVVKPFSLYITVQFVMISGWQIRNMLCFKGYPISNWFTVLLNNYEVKCVLFYFIDASLCDCMCY